MKDIENLVINAYSEKKIQEIYNESIKEGLWKSEETLVKEYFKEGSKILDVGCGSGRTTFQLFKMGYDCIGIDLVPKMIESAKNNCSLFGCNIEFKVMNVRNLEFDNETFDGALFSFCGWNQIPKKENRLKALEKLYRVLKNKSYLILTSYSRNNEDLWIRDWLRINFSKIFRLKTKEVEVGDIFFQKGGKEEYKEEQFIHFPSLKEIKKQIRKVGFNLVFYDQRNNIAKEDKNLDIGNCTFFVCEKVA